jgi:uncharacterized protein (TIGR02118 family)
VPRCGRRPEEPAYPPPEIIKKPERTGAMPTKITVIYDNPKDPDAFEAGYHEQRALAIQIPGVQRVESAKVWPKEDGSATPAYRLLDMYFAGYGEASEAVKTGQAAAFVSKVFELATGGVRIVFADIEES